MLDKWACRAEERRARHYEPTARLLAFEKFSEPLMLLLALASLPLLYLEDHWQDAVWLGFAIVFAFAVDLVVRVWLAPAPRLRYLRAHWLDLLIVVLTVLPLLRPLRAARPLHLLRLLRGVLLVAKAWQSIRTLWGQVRGRGLLIACKIGVWVALATVFLAERAAPHGTIKTFGDSLWWVASTVTTVGYGDISPVTTLGRIAAALLMAIGIGAFGIITANVTAYYMRETGSAAEGHCPHCGVRLSDKARPDKADSDKTKAESTRG